MFVARILSRYIYVIKKTICRTAYLRADVIAYRNKGSWLCGPIFLQVELFHGI